MRAQVVVTDHGTIYPADAGTDPGAQARPLPFHFVCACVPHGMGGSREAEVMARSYGESVALLVAVGWVLVHFGDGTPHVLCSTECARSWTENLSKRRARSAV